MITTTQTPSEAKEVYEFASTIVWHIERSLKFSWHPWMTKDGRRLCNANEVVDALIRGELEPLPLPVILEVDLAES